MERSEIERDYQVINGVIRTPGKFEGEAVYMPACWEVYLDGCSEDVESGDIMYSRVEVDRAMRAQFPELEDKEFVVFYETNDGFVTEVETSQEDWEALSQGDLADLEC